MKNEITDTFAAEWTECMMSFKLLSPNVQNIIRRSAVDQLVRDGAEEVGSSDRNHSIFAMWKQGQRDWNNVVLNAFEDFIVNHN